MAAPFLPGVFSFLARSDDRVAKRARDSDLLSFSEEADARGSSSTVPERSLALRRRRAPSSISSTWGSGWIATVPTADELCFGCEEAAASFEEAEIVDSSCFSHFCNFDVLALHRPPLSTFVTSDGGIVILEEARDDGPVAAVEHGCGHDEAGATRDAVGSAPASPETETVDPYFFCCLTL